MLKLELWRVFHCDKATLGLNVVGHQRRRRPALADKHAQADSCLIYGSHHLDERPVLMAESLRVLVYLDVLLDAFEKLDG